MRQVHKAENYIECLDLQKGGAKMKKTIQAWQITAITNFILACEAFLGAGFLLGRIPIGLSASLFWTIGIFFFAAGFLLGGIDHGFYEQRGNTKERLRIQKISWICGAITTYSITLSTAFQFTSGIIFYLLAIVGLFQLAAFITISIRIHNFLIVMMNYFPILLLILILNIIGLWHGSGSLFMILGILVTFIASALEGIGVDLFAPLDRHGLYHIVMMIAIALLFVATFGLKAKF